MNRLPAPCSLLTAAVVLALSLSACSRKEEPPASAAVTPPAASAQAPASPTPPPPANDGQAEAGPQQKLNLYIGCYNEADSSFRRSLNRYASWVRDMNAGPTGKERIVYGLYSVRGAQACQQAIAQANAMPPKMAALEQAASAYAASLTPLQATMTEAYTYYDRENYKDDDFAKGKALHKTLAGQAGVFNNASRRFSDALDDANDAQQQARLQRLEKTDGHNLAYYHLSVMIQAKQLVRLLTQDDVDVAKAGERIDTLEKTIDEMSKAPGDKPMMWSSYSSEVDDFRKAAKALYRRLRDKTPYSQGEQMMLNNNGSGWMVEGSPDRMLRAYNEMVESSNRLD